MPVVQVTDPVSGLSAVGAYQVTGPSQGPLPLPASLTGSWQAPAGIWSAPAKTCTVNGTALADLSAATILGSAGNLFTVTDQASLTVYGGTVSGPMSGIVAVPSAAAVGVDLEGLATFGVLSLIAAKSAGGWSTVNLRSVVASGLAVGVSLTAQIIDVQDCVLTGGGPSASPTGLHALKDPANMVVAYPGSLLRVLRSTITGFVSTGFQGDAILPEAQVAQCVIDRCVLGHNTDSGGVDSKATSCTITNSVIYSDGDRAISCHYGTLTSAGNLIYQVPQSASGGQAKAFQGTGTLISTGDVVILQTGAKLAVADVVLAPGSGPAATYPRVGNLTINQARDGNGQPVLGPVQISPGGGYTPTVTVNP